MRKRCASLVVLVVLLLGAVSLAQAGGRDARYANSSSASAAGSRPAPAQNVVTLQRLLSDRLLRALKLAKEFGLLDLPSEPTGSPMSTRTIVDEPDPVGQTANEKNRQTDEEKEAQERQEKEKDAGKKGKQIITSVG